jgi:hypothetical protein
MTNVVRVNFRPEPSTFDEAWALVPASMRKRCKRLSVLREAWDRHARDFGQTALLGALRAYVTDKDFDRHGGQALDRWLAGGRYEHFTPATPRPIAAKFFDDNIRSAVVAAAGDDFAAVYLDPCVVEGTTLIARTQVAVDRLLQHRALFKSLGFTGVRKATTCPLKNENVLRTNPGKVI